ncbi:MAG: hypothetical protein WCR52_17120 [Bacteroidota bacterium]
MKKDDELRRKWADKFDDYEQEPQAETWENIRKAIQPKRKRRFFWLFYWAMGLGLLLGAGQVVYKSGGRETGDGGRWTGDGGRRTGDGGGLTGDGGGLMGDGGRLTGDGVATENQVETASTIGKNDKINLGIDARRSIQKDIIGVSKTALYPLGAVTEGGQTSSAASEMFRPDASAGALAISGQVGNDSLLAVQNINNQALVSEVLKIDTTKLASLSALPLPIIGIINPPKQLPFPPSSPVVVQRKPQRKAVFTADISVLSAFQLMESQWIKGVGATDIQVLPALDARRLGVSLSAGFRLPLGQRGTVDLGLNWMNLPYRAVYSEARTNQVKVDIQSGVQYRVSPTPTRDISDAKRLNWFGAQFDYGYNVSIFKQKIRVFAGAEGLWSVQAAEPEMWGRAGFGIPVGNGRYQIVPVFKYQFNRIEQPDGLLKTRLYALGLGVKRIFH